MQHTGWRWAAPRVLTVLALAAAAVAGACPAAWADERAEAMLKQSQEAVRRLQSIQANIELAVPAGRTYTGTVLLKRPNRARLELNGMGVQLVVSDGKEAYIFFPQQKQYRKLAPGADGRSIPLEFVEPLAGFFRVHPAVAAARGKGATVAGEERVDGVDCAIVEMKAPPPRVSTTRYYISGTDHLIHRIVVTMVAQGQTLTRSVTLKKIQTNAILPDSLFAWKPPPSAKPLQNPAAEAGLLKVGDAAPAFTLPGLDGAPVTLAGLQREKKAVLILFWSVGEGPLVGQIARVQRLYDAQKAKGLEVVAINLSDDPEAVKRFVGTNRFTMKMALNAGAASDAAAAYLAHASPTLYLVGADGHVLWRGIGLNQESDAALRQALAAAGVR